MTTKQVTGSCEALSLPTTPTGEAMSASEEVRFRSQSVLPKVAREVRPVIAHALRALNVADALSASRAKHDANGHLSDSGKAANRRADAEKVALRFVLSDIGVARQKGAQKSQVDALRKSAFEPFRGDALSAEIRAAVKSLSPSETIKLAQGDPRVLAALAEAPPIVHGLPADLVDSMAQGFLEKSFPAEFSKAKAQDDAAGEAFDCADAAVRIGREQLKAAVSLPHDKAFVDWLTKVANPTAVQIEAEASGKTAPGLPAHDFGDSVHETMSGILDGLPK